MKLLTEITSDYKQKHRVVLENGEEFDFTLEFIEQQEGWFYSIKYGDNFEIKGQRLVLGMNILRKWKNLLPFGIGVISENLIEPSLIDDFISGRVDINILNSSDVQYIEEQVYGQ